MPSLSATPPALCNRESGSAMTRRSPMSKRQANALASVQPNSVNVGASRSRAPPKPASSSSFCEGTCAPSLDFHGTELT
jgi:hypothetical protein